MGRWTDRARDSQHSVRSLGRMRAQRDLRGVLPHLRSNQRLPAHQGSAALLEGPVWALQRGLQQQLCPPADSLDERAQFRAGWR